jgi:hypothetical protein
VEEEGQGEDQGGRTEAEEEEDSARRCDVMRCDVLLLLLPPGLMSRVRHSPDCVGHGAGTRRSYYCGGRGLNASCALLYSAGNMFPTNNSAAGRSCWASHS